MGGMGGPDPWGSQGGGNNSGWGEDPGWLNNTKGGNSGNNSGGWGNNSGGGGWGNNSGGNGNGGWDDGGYGGGYGGNQGGGPMRGGNNYNMVRIEVFSNFSTPKLCKSSQNSSTFQVPVENTFFNKDMLSVGS